ncbi:phosphopantetheine-binding protein [Streptomyces sp. NPDC056405]|uniref:phosphopantetheine-binding protein n=1 Tax=Streptomyces sp. NPDC056405 TaxID=3345811 RepID=UPI0035E2512A
MTEHVETVDAATLMVCDAWEAVLTHKDFDSDSDFFAVGGNSYLVAKVMANLSQRVGVRLPLRLFFGAPTVRGLGQAVADHLEHKTR